MTVLLLFLTILINIVIQSTILPYFEIFGVVPNTALIIIVVIALGKGKYYGGLFGILVGLINDILFSMTLGLNAIIYFFIGYFIGFVEDTFVKDNILNPIIFTGLSTVFYSIVYSLFLYFLSREISFIDAVNKVFSLEVIYNCLVSILIYKAYQLLFAQPKIRFGKR